MKTPPALATVAVTMILALAGCTREGSSGSGQAESPAPKIEQWKFAIEEIQGSVQDSYARKFEERIEEKSGGRIDVTVYPYGTLGTSDQLTELVQNGAIQLAMASPGHLGKLIPESQVFLLHFVFDDDADANRAALASDGLLGRFQPLYRAKGLELLSFFQEGWMVWTTQREVRTPADFAGMKIRVMTSPMLLAAYEAYGANPTPMAYSEVYSGLQLGMIDGQVNPIFAVEEMSFHEVTQVLTIAKHAPFVASAIAGKTFWDGLDDERRGWIRDTVAELDAHVFDVQRRFNEERLDTIREERPEMTIVRLDDEARAAFREASLPVRDVFVEATGESGREVLDTLLAEVRRAAPVEHRGDADR